MLLKPQSAKAETGITKIDSINRPAYLMIASSAIDESGNIYTLGLSPIDNNAAMNNVRKYNAEGMLLTEWGDAESGDGQLLEPRAITIDNNGYIYVMDSESASVKKFDGSGQYLSQFGSEGSSAGQFINPQGIAIDSLNNIYVVDTDNNRIQKFDNAGNFVSTWGWGVEDGLSEFQICTADCQAGSSGTEAGQFSYFAGITTDAASNIYVVDSGNNRIQKFDNAGNFVSTWGWGVEDGLSEFQICTADCQVGNSGSGDGQFSDDVGRIALDNMSNVYVSDAGNNRIQKFSSSGNYLTQWGSQGSGNGEFFYPYGVTVGPSNNIYAVDSYNYRIQQFDTSGNFLSIPLTLDVPFLLPVGTTTDNDGNLYVANLYGPNIIKLDSTNNFITSWILEGSLPYSIVASDSSLYATAYNNMDDGIIIYKTDQSGNIITSWDPVSDNPGLAIDSDENVYHFDSESGVMKKYTSSGILVDEWGSIGTGDGQFGGAEFAYIAIDHEDNVYVPDSGNNRMQKFTSDGTYLTQWGADSFGGSEFRPVSVAADKLGNVYINDIVDFGDDDSTSIIRKFDKFGNYFGQYAQAPDEQSGLPFLSYGIVTGFNGRIYATDSQNSRIEILCDHDVSTNNCADTLPLITLSSAENSTPITLSQTGCTNVTNSSATKESNLTTADPAYSYPVGLIAFTMNGCTNGGTATITATFTGSFDPSSTTIRKYNTSNNTYTTLTQSNSNLSLSTTTLNNQPALQVTYTITDGGALDQDNTVNGTIVDPVGLAAASVGVPNTGL